MRHENVKQMLRRSTADATGPIVRVGKSRSAGTASGATGVTVVQDGDSLGRYEFWGTDGDEYILGSVIESIVDGTPANGIVPTTLVISSADAGGTLRERLRIDSKGRFRKKLANGNYAGDVMILQGSTGAANTTLTGTPPISTSETTLATMTVPGKLLGPNGFIRVIWLASFSSSASSKTFKVKYGGTTFQSIAGFTSSTTARYTTLIQNRNNVAQQVCMPIGQTGGGWGSSTSGTIMTGTVDSDSDQTLLLSGQLASSSDTMILESIVVETCYLP